MLYYFFIKRHVETVPFFPDCFSTRLKPFFCGRFFSGIFSVSVDFEKKSLTIETVCVFHGVGSCLDMTRFRGLLGYWSLSSVFLTLIIFRMYRFFPTFFFVPPQNKWKFCSWSSFGVLGFSVFRVLFLPKKFYQTSPVVCAWERDRERERRICSNGAMVVEWWCQGWGSREWRPSTFFSLQNSTHELATRPTRPYHATWCVCLRSMNIWCLAEISASRDLSVQNCNRPW